MRHKVCELEGTLLDAAVAKAEGWYRQEWENSADFEWRGAPLVGGELGPIEAGPEYSPSTDWACGGPVVERESIGVTRRRCGTWIACRAGAGIGSAGKSSETLACTTGTTFLVAAMRAYVKDKFGDEVDLT
jgi:hypothetical protein